MISRTARGILLRQPLTSLLDFCPTWSTSRYLSQDNGPDQNSSNPKQQPEASSSSPSSGQKKLLDQHIQQLQQLRGSTKVMRQTMSDDFPPWQAWIYNAIGAKIQSWITAFIQTRIETDFNLEETLEAALDAFWTFHQLVGKEDFETLKTMVSAKVLDAVKKTGEDYRSNGLIWRVEIDPDSLEAQLRGVGFWVKDQIKEYDEEQASMLADDTPRSMQTMPSGSWLVLSVQFRAKQKVTITREEDGIVVAELEDSRATRWKFANGPLPDNLPSRQLSTPWWLLSL